MFNEPGVPERQPEARAPRPWQPEENEDAWERVLDCGAPGPARAEPALFYQAMPNDDSPSPSRRFCSPAPRSATERGLRPGDHGPRSAAERERAGE